jgi:glycosyltransferase involved in cell wall biosynthesis
MSSDQPLRIAHFTLGRCNPDSANGVDQTVYHLARTQAAFGHAVAVFSLTEKEPLAIPGVAVSTCPPVKLPLPFLTKRGRDLFIARSPWNVPSRLVTQVTDWRPDVLHLHFVHIPPNVFLARRLSPAVPYCVTINGGLSPVAQRRNRWTKQLFKVMFERKYLERAAFLHAISVEDMHGLEHYGIANTTVLAPNGIDVDSLPTTFDDTALARLDERLQGRRAFLFLGRLDPQQKGLDLLLNAFAACRPDDWALVLVGPDWRGAQRELQALASSIGIRDAVVFAGPAFGKCKADLLRAADVFVHPSRWEAGVPFSVLEAAALQRPCLLSAVADPGGILERGGAALSVAPTVDGIAAGLAQMSAMPSDTLRAMGSRAREIVTAMFNWPRSASILIDAYRTHAVSIRG